MITRVPAWSDTPSGNVTRRDLLASPSGSTSTTTATGHARLHASVPGEEANLLGICLRPLLANLGPEGVGQIGLSALLRLRGRGCLRLRLGLRFRSALLGNRMRCADDHRSH